jgi:hypothetical protein
MCWPLSGADRRELSLDEVLSDPLIRAVMAADHVDPDRLAADLRETRRHLRRISS